MTTALLSSRCLGVSAAAASSACSTSVFSCCLPPVRSQCVIQNSVSVSVSVSASLPMAFGCGSLSQRPFSSMNHYAPLALSSISSATSTSTILPSSMSVSSWRHGVSTRSFHYCSLCAVTNSVSCPGVAHTQQYRSFSTVRLSRSVLSIPLQSQLSQTAPVRRLWTYRFVEHVPIKTPKARYIPQFPPSHFRKLRNARRAARRAAYTPSDPPILVEHKNMSLPSLVSNSSLAAPYVTNSQATVAPAHRLSVLARTRLEESKAKAMSKSVFEPFKAPANVFAVIHTPGKQLKVLETDAFMSTARMFGKEVGTSMVLDKVMILGAREFTVLGHPYIPNAKVHVTIEEHVKTKHQLVFKKRRRKGYRRVLGFRTTAHIVRIDRIELPEDIAQYARGVGVTTRTEEEVLEMKGITTVNGLQLHTHTPTPATA